MRKHGFVLAAVVLGGVLLVASLAVAGGGKKNLKAGDLNGYEENPDVSTAATGSFKVSIDDEARELTYRLSYSGLEGTVTQAHIHFAKAGVNGGISLWLCQTATNAPPAGPAVKTCPQSGTVEDTLGEAHVIGPAGQGITAGEFDEIVAALRAGHAYANVHSSPTFGNGEIRAQINANGERRLGTSRRGPGFGQAPRRLMSLDPRDHREAERGRSRAVDDTVVERDRDRPGPPHDDLVVSYDRSRRDAPDAQDRDLGVVHDRRGEEPGELAGARDGERRVRGAPRPSAIPHGPLGELRDLRRRARRRSSRRQPRTTGTTRPSSVCTATPMS